ncbi:Eukaryotic translation initiation factor 4E type 2 [Dissophora globulifera]|nr:Eukaryotic translation initiation factor 4E type 2 [Dissophora globulifera]
MDSVWGSSRKQTRAPGDGSVPAGGSKLVQLQRQSSAIGSGLPSLSTTSLSSISSGPLSSSINNSGGSAHHGSGAIHPGLSAFLTGPSSSSNTAGESLDGGNSGNVSRGGAGGDYSMAGSGSSRITGLSSLSSSGSGLGYGGGGISSAASAGMYGGAGGAGAGGLSTPTSATFSGNAVFQNSSSIGSGVGGGAGGTLSEIHPLHFNWVFWFMHRAPGSKILNYESSMKKIATFGSVEDFWAVYSHLRRPHELPHVSDYHLFKQGVRPVWEDAANIHGGKWIVRLKKGLASRYWENLVMAVIGDQFDVGSEICGLVLSIRGAEDILSIWNQSAHEGRINLKIRDTMKRVLNLPADTIMEYKTHNDALKDNSSFRNTDVFR